MGDQMAAGMTADGGDSPSLLAVLTGCSSPKVSGADLVLTWLADPRSWSTGQPNICSRTRHASGCGTVLTCPAYQRSNCRDETVIWPRPGSLSTSATPQAARLD